MTPAGPAAIRRACDADAEAVVGVIARAARLGNANDYSDAQLDELLGGFTHREVLNKIRTRETFVAVDPAGAVVGTAAFSGGFARSVFVDPDHHGAGIGRRLMDEVESAARRAGCSMLEVHSSLTAVGFYEKRGYERRRAVPDRVPTVLMAKRLSATESN